MNNCIMVRHNAQKKVLQNVTLFGKNSVHAPGCVALNKYSLGCIFMQIRRASLVGAPAKKINPFAGFKWGSGRKPGDLDPT